MKETKEKKDGKFKRILKSRVVIGLVCLIIGASTNSDTSRIEKLEGEIKEYEQSIETLSRESKSQLSIIEAKDSQVEQLQAKVDDASPWFDMSEEERELEKERIAQAKAQKEEDARVAKEQEEQAKKQAEEKKKQEEAAAVTMKSENNNNSSSNNDSNSSSNQSVDEANTTEVWAENTATVLVTPTGKKYHKRACGRGNYSQATLSEAESRGLSPCSKCY